MANKNESIEFKIEKHKLLQTDFIVEHTLEAKEPQVILLKSDFDIFHKKHGIKLPDELIYFCSQIGCGENDFTSQIKYYLGNDVKPTVLVHFSEKFAKLVCEKYHNLSGKEKEYLSNEIEKIDNGRFLSQYQREIDYLLVEGTSTYDLGKDIFSLSFLDKIYQENYDENLLIKSLLMWAHCGGCGSIILNTTKKGYNSGEMFGHFLEIEYRGKKYEYHSNYWIATERHHLEEYQDLIDKEIILLEERRKQPKTV